MMTRMTNAGLTDSFDIGMQEIDRLGLQASFDVVRRGSASVMTCRMSREGTALMMGLGRRDGRLGRTSALFEALERLAVRQSGPDGHSSILAVAKQPEIPSTDVVHRISQTHPAAMLSTWTFRGADAELEYPTLITNPFLATEEARRTDFGNAYLRYSSGLGTAAGVEVDQAVLHGVLELIEHDAISLAYLGWFVSGIEAVRVVPPADMPAAVSERRDALHEATGRRVRLVDITTDLAIPCFLALMDDPAGDIPIYGSAARLDASDAAIKALGEVEQMWSLHGAMPDADRTLARWPVLERCRRLDLPAHLLVDHVPDWEARADADENALLVVTDALERAGLSVFHRSLSEPESLISVVSCLVPGLERFSMVRSGMPVVPTGRGRAIWEQGQALR